MYHLINPLNLVDEINTQFNTATLSTCINESPWAKIMRDKFDEDWPFGS